MGAPKKNGDKKKCNSCGHERALRTFYKTDSPMFPDGHINICNSCVKEQVDINSEQSVINFLRQIDKPFIKGYWEKSLEGKHYPLGNYIAKVNSLRQVDGKNFDSTNQMGVGTTADVKAADIPDEIKTDEGEIITFHDDLKIKWGIGYQKHEYLQLEKFYEDMMASYDVINANHKQMLMKIAKLTVEMDKLLAIKDYANYQKISSAYNQMLDAAGFAPKNKKNGADATGLTSFSQVWAEIEKEGFIQPKMIDYPKDDIDATLLYFVQFAQRFTGRQVSAEVDPNWREQVIYAENSMIDDEDDHDLDAELERIRMNDAEMFDDGE